MVIRLSFDWKGWGHSLIEQYHYSKVAVSVALKFYHYEKVTAQGEEFVIEYCKL